LQHLLQHLPSYGWPHNNLYRRQNGGAAADISTTNEVYHTSTQRHIENSIMSILYKKPYKILNLVQTWYCRVQIS